MASEVSETQPLLGHEPKPNSTSIQRWRESKSLFTLAVCTIAFADNYMYGMIIPIAPTALRDRVGIPEQQLQRVTSIMLAVFGATFVVFCPLTVLFASRVPAFRWTLLATSVVGFAANILYCLGRKLWILIVARGLQGASAATVGVAGFAVLIERMGNDQAGPAIGYMSVSVSTGALGGLLLGGLIYDYLGYYATFVVALAILAIGTFLVLIVKQPNSKSPAKQSRNNNDEEASVSRVSESPSQGSPLDSRKPQLSRSYRIAKTIVCTLAVMMGTLEQTGYEATLPIFTHDTYGWSPTRNSLLFLTFIPPALFGPYVGSVADKYGPFPISSGLCLGMIVVHGLFCLVSSPAVGHIILLCFLCAAVGACEPIHVTANLTGITRDTQSNSKHPRRTETLVSCALTSMAIAGGATLGPVIAGYTKDAFGWNVMNIVLAALNVLVLILIAGLKVWERQARLSS